MADGTIDMTLSEQVCSLELAKRLKELGVKQESCFWWCDPSDGDKADVGFIRDNHVGYKVYYSAFTVAELGEMLAKGMDMSWRSTTGEWNCRYTLVSESGNAVGTSASTEADARAKMFIYLLENKLITL